MTTLIKLFKIEFERGGTVKEPKKRLSLVKFSHCFFFHFLAENVSRRMNNFFRLFMKEFTDDAKLSANEEIWHFQTRITF